MRLTNFFSGNVGRGSIPLAILAMLVSSLCCYHYFSSTPVVEAQARPKPGKARPKVQTQPKTPGTTFSHETHRAPKTKLICSGCHTIPAREAPDAIAAATKASIKGFPYHDSCLECHRRSRPLFFSGAAPVICTVCHTRSSPRLTARELNKFPQQSEPAMEVEFPGYYPHDHRDHKRVNCASCHVTDERPYVAIAIGGEAAYKPPEGTFKTSPAGHAACFKCHWEDEKPRKDDCAGCHLMPDAVAQKPRNVVSPNAIAWFKSWPHNWPKRLSVKFNHESKDHDDECTTCHDLTRIETLDLLKAEVPIGTCAKSNCHFSSTARPSISKEMFEEDEDIAEARNNDHLSQLGKHSCTGCHTNTIGSTPPPCSHYLLFGDRYLKLEDYPRSAEQIAERCKK